jgi:hypothetical protein
MHGHLWQPCADWFSPDYYTRSPFEDPTGPDAGTERVIRGGIWWHNAAVCRAANRWHKPPADLHNSAYGFRVVVDVPAESAAAPAAAIPATHSGAGVVLGPAAIAPPPAAAPFDAKKAKERPAGAN